jgi:sugar phosphate isomerase/epimerase
MNKTILDRVSYHAVYDGSILEALQYAKANGFTGVQIAVETPHLSFERLSDQDVRAIAQLAAAEGLYTTLHAPDHAASLFQCSRYLSEGVLNYYRALFSFAHAIGSRSVTIHLGTMAVFPADDETSRRIPGEDLPLCSFSLQKNLERLLRMAEGRFAICVENCDVGLAELELLQPYLERGDLFLCWDLVNSAGRSDMEGFYLSHPECIKQVHLHDRREVASGSIKGHGVIGTGDIDFAGCLGFLMEKADVEDFCIEVRPREKARESLFALAQIVQQLGVDPSAATNAENRPPEPSR